MSTQLRIGERANAEVHFVDQAGNPTGSPGPVHWSSSAPNVASVEQANGGDQHAIITGINMGSAMISASSGTISESVSVMVLAGPAVSARITVSEPYSRR